MLRGVADLRDIDHRGGAGIDHAERRHQHARIGVRDLIGRRQRGLNVAIVVRIEQPAGQHAAQQPLIGVAVGVDEPGDDDVVCGVDAGDVVAGHRDVGTNLADLAALDQDVRLREVADLPIDRQHDTAFDQDAAPGLQAGEVGIGDRSLRQSRRRQQRGYDAGGGERGARLEKPAPRRRFGPEGAGVIAAHAQRAGLAVAVGLSHGRPPGCGFSRAASQAACHSGDRASGQT